jgi:glycosyltransferase involved in cell wall biosynthesis
MKKLTIVIPNKLGQTPDLTIETLYRQNFLDFDVIIINDNSGNANVARNEGLSMVDSEYVLFSDNDINWKPYALSTMIDCLERNRDISYAWGSYELNGKVWCNREWDPEALKQRNYISTMSVVRTADHPGFDEKIKRLQDWDVWLTMLSQGKKGKYTGRLIFTTPVRNGITRDSISLSEAIASVKLKHKLN